MREINIRLISGEIFSEILKMELRHDSELVNIDHKQVGAIIDIATGVLARHIGETLADDDCLPVNPLPLENC